MKPTRAVDFTTSEATWISLDVSPDGRKIVFLSDRSGSENIWVCGGTLDEVWPRAKPLPPMWWWDREPKGIK